MAMALKLDTLSFSKRLREAGADERLAEAIVDGITSAYTSELSTKADISELKTEMKTEISFIEALDQELKDEEA